MSRVYWHIQMNLPEGRESDLTINSKPMLLESPPVIGTGEWDNPQCENFKGLHEESLKIGDIILVREGKKPLALCKVTGNNFKDAVLQKKYVNENFRQVKVLEWYKDTEDFPQPQGTLQRLINTDKVSWIFIDDWYNNFLMNEQINIAIELLESKGQLILQGPPGTGKTYTAKDIAEKLIFGRITDNKEMQRKYLESSEQFKLVQFHPSYSYEDFVRGIVANNNGDNIEYRTVEKTLGLFAKKAYKNLIDSQKAPEEASTEQWIRAQFDEFKEDIIEELSHPSSHGFALNSAVSIISVEEDAFRYTGGAWKNELRMKFEDIIQLYLNKIVERRDIKQQPYVSALAKAHATYFKLLLDRFYEFMNGKTRPRTITSSITKGNYVLIIDEMNRANLSSVLGELIYALEYRNEAVDSMYEIDGDTSLVVPSNLFVIGTMNTADRSVGHIDYAIRRRFAFLNILPSDTVIGNKAGRDLFLKVQKLFSEGKMAPEFEEKDVLIGHSYFLADNDERLRTKLEYEIKPILREYVKDGILLPEMKTEIESLSV